MLDVRPARRGVRRMTDALRIAAMGSTVVARNLTATDQRLRAPVSTSRRIAILQADGGAGATALVALAGTVLGRRRGGGVLVVDATRGQACLAARIGVQVPLSLAQTRSRVAGVVRADQVRELLPRSAAGVSVIGAGTDEHEPWPARPESWRDAVDPVGRFFDVVVTDWGVRAADDELAQIAASHHVVAVAARADRGCAERGLALAGRIGALAPGTRVALILVDIGGTGGSTAALVARQPQSSPAALWVEAVPYESRLAAAVCLDAAAPLALTARGAYARVAGGLLSLSREAALPARSLAGSGA